MSKQKVSLAEKLTSLPEPNIKRISWHTRLKETHPDILTLIEELVDGFLANRSDIIKKIPHKMYLCRVVSDILEEDANMDIKPNTIREFILQRERSNG